MSGYTLIYRMACGNVYVTYNFEGGKLLEIFMRIGKSGGCQACQAQAFGRIVSISLQSGDAPEKLGKTLIGMQCPGAQSGEPGKRLSSCLDGIGRELIAVGAGSVQFVDGARIERKGTNDEGQKTS